MSAEAEFTDPAISRIAEFLTSIGIPVIGGEVAPDSFLPGIRIERGFLIADPARLLYPGDLLHEAGHLAVLPAAQRAEAIGQPGSGPGEEMAAIAWSYAAALHIGLDPEVVFHAAGYKGGAQAILDNFREGRYVGVPLLQWMGLTADSSRASTLGVDPYPCMLRWLRE